MVAGTHKQAANQVYNVHDDTLPMCREYLRAYKKYVTNVRSVSVPYIGLQLFSKIFTKYHEYSKGQLRSIGWRQLVSTDEGLRRSFAAFQAELKSSNMPSADIDLSVRSNRAQDLIVLTQNIAGQLRERV